MADRKEYIERGALLEYLAPHADNENDLQPVVVMEFVESIPAADVVEVVRCRNCKHKVNFQNRIMCDRNARYSAVHSEWYGLTATDNDNFCSYGERKDGDNNAAD